MAENIPDFYLEQYVLGELKGDKKKLIDDSPALQERADQLRKSNEDILNRYPPAQFSASFQSHSEKKTRKPVILEFVIKARVPLIAAACLALFFATLPIMVNRSQDTVGITDEMTRIKGMEPTIHIYRENNGESELLSDQAVVYERDRLQISYIASGKKYGTIFSIDGRGTVTLHYPEAESLAPILDSEGEIPLPYSYELDDAPQYEEFIFLTTDSEFSVSELLEIVRSSPTKLNLPNIFDKTTVYLRKE